VGGGEFVGMRGRLAVLGLSVSLAANATLGYFVWRLSEDLTNKASTDTATNLEAALSDLENEAEELGQEMEDMRSTPGFDPSTLEQKLRSLQNEVNALNRSSTDYLDFLVELDDQGIHFVEQPSYCRGGDVVYWTSDGYLDC
jgi:hypothetical protein